MQHRQQQHQSLLFAVFGQQTDASPNGRLRRLDVGCLAEDGDLAGVNRVSAKDRAHQLRPSGAHQAGNAQDFAAVGREADVVQRARPIEPFDAQRFLAAPAGSFGYC